MKNKAKGGGGGKVRDLPPRTHFGIPVHMPCQSAVIYIYYLLNLSLHDLKGLHEINKVIMIFKNCPFKKKICVPDQN